ncbi:LOW QUALITY PROTEIN: protein inturned [Centruroides vittatus]|uniref:LOW QUALITY PROTEIN: protein inturned n=1 Tax=Centruroides vittatus TaxID=120091 RepID=UPI0035105044
MAQSNSCKIKGSSHVNPAFRHEQLSDNSESSEELSSDSFSDGAYELEWSEKIGSKGNLFYVESIQNSKKTTLDAATSADSENANSIETHHHLKPRPVNKLKKWVKKQKYKSEEQTHKNNFQRPVSMPKVTFRGSPNGETKEVLLDVDPRRHNYGRRATLCEVLFGIIPGHFHQLDNRNSSAIEDDRIMVQGFTPDGEAIKNGKIKIGDWLKSVDDIEVNMNTIGEILSTITTAQKVKLTVQRFAGHSSINNPSQEDYNPLVKQLSGDRCTMEEINLTYCHIPHIILYLTIGTDNDSLAKEDGVLYKFPEEDSTLLSLKGMFITLNHMIADVTSSPPLNSTLMIDEQLVHAGYVREGREVMVLALPDTCISSSEIQCVSNDLGRFIRIQYHMLGKAFGDHENKESLDHFFSLFFIIIFLEPLPNYKPLRDESIFTDTLLCAHSFHFTAEIETQIDTTLNELESADFDDMSEAYYNTQRLYTILGSCVFYKGYLLANHLPKEDFLDIFLYTKLYQLLNLTAQEQLSQVIIWREIFPTRRYNDNDSQKNNDRGYREPDGRWFLLIVALNHTLLGIILEAGGCSLQAKGHPTPDPFYVDQAQNTLLQLESLGIIAHIEKFLESESCPQICYADWFGSKNKFSKRNFGTFSKASQPLKSTNQKTLSQSNLLNISFSSSPGTGTRKMPEITSILKKKTSIDGERQQLLSTVGQGDADSDAETTHSPGTSDEMTPILGRRGKTESSSHTSASSDADSRTSSEGAIYRSQKSHRIFPNNYDLSSIKKSLEEAEEEITASGPIKLVAGKENTLFHYINVDVANGIFIAPTDHVNKWIRGPVHTEIINNFHRCCLQIRKLFQATLKQKEISKNRESAKFGLSTLTSVKEHGVLFHFTPPTNNNPKKSPSTVAYWVVGRLFFTPNPHEVYVCFHDSASQNVVELAFRLGFGMTS